MQETLAHCSCTIHERSLWLSVTIKKFSLSLTIAKKILIAEALWKVVANIIWKITELRQLEYFLLSCRSDKCDGEHSKLYNLKEDSERTKTTFSSVYGVLQHYLAVPSIFGNHWLIGSLKHNGMSSLITDWSVRKPWPSLVHQGNNFKFYLTKNPIRQGLGSERLIDLYIASRAKVFKTRLCWLHY